MRFVLITLFTFLLNSFVAFANINQLMVNTESNALMIRSDSNALMTLDLNDDDYAVMPMSSIGTVTNTLTCGRLPITILYYDSSGSVVSRSTYAELNRGRYDFYYEVPEGCKIYQFVIQLYNYDNALPAPGNYYLSYDLSSDFSLDYENDPWLRANQIKNNVANTLTTDRPDMSTYSGDVFLNNYAVSLGSLYYLYIVHDVDYSDSPRYIGGSFAIRFEDSDMTGVSLGKDTGTADYENDVSSSLGNLSSSVDSMTEEIGGVAEAIQNLQGAMEPHYNNVLTQLHHITEQLHAFYDQIYNNIHLKEYALWQDIKTAIENIDLEVNVNLDKLKTSIDNMSQAVQNKLQSVTDTITGGYNNSGMQEDNNELSGALDELDNAEQEVLDDVNGYIEGFEYPSFDGISSGIIGALSFFGGLLHSIFLGMGEFGLIITFSLTMIFVLIIVGYHRIRS